MKTEVKTEVKTKAPHEGRERKPIDQFTRSIMTMRRITLLTLAGLAALVGTPSWAITGTAANTTITNDVTLSYAVGTVDQDDITTDVDFLVDRKFDVVVAAVATTYPTSITDNGVAPGTDEAVLLFTVTNQSNFDPDMLVEAFENEENVDPFAGTIDDIINQIEGGVVSALSTTVGTVNGYQYDANDAGNTCGSELTSGTDAGYIPSAAWAGDGNDTMLVCIYVDIPLTSDLTTASVDDGDIIPWSLAAGFSDPDGTAGDEYFTDDADTADDANALEDVFADLTDSDAEDVQYAFSTNTAVTATQDVQANGLHVDTSAFIIRAPELVLTKTALTVWDPINGLAGNNHTVANVDVAGGGTEFFDVWDNPSACTSSCPKAIPLAVVQYTIEIENQGTVQADDIAILDNIDANTVVGVQDAGAGNFLNNDATTDVDDQNSSNVSSVYVDRCAAEAAADSLDAFGGTADVDVTVGDCDGGETAFVYYYVTIQ